MSDNNNSNQAQQMVVKKFIVNYQSAFKNYNNAIKYYTKYKQMIEEIEKIFIAYKEIIKDFQKKVIALNSNLKKIFLNEDMKSFKYDIFPTTNNKYIKYLNNIFNLHISSITNIINDLDKNENVFKSSYKKEEPNFLNILQQNKNNLQNEQKKMEKSINEYDNEHKNLMYIFQDTEENLRNIFIKKRKERRDSKTKKHNNNMDKFNSTISNIIKFEEKFRNLDMHFQKNNSNYFNIYNQYLIDIKTEILKNSKYVHENFLSISSILTNNYETIIGKLKEFNEKIKKNTQTKLEKKEESKEEGKEEKIEKENENEIKKEGISPKKEENLKTKNEITQKEETPKNEEENKNENNKKNSEFVNEDYNLYISKNFNKIETTYEKEKYKVKAIKETVLDDKLGKETKNIMNDLSFEFGLGHLVEEEIIVLTDEDVYEITKTLYGPFQYVDKSEYDLVIERKKIDFKNLTNKLLYFGLKEKALKNYPDLSPITDEEVKLLESGLKKKEYRITFLQRLNNYRALGILDMPQKEFEIIGNFFKMIADYIDEDKDVDSTRFLIILSQTFYLKDENNKKDKKYLQIFIKGHKFFSDKKFWKEYIENSIKGEIDKLDKMVKKNNGKIKRTYNDICFAQILPFSDNMAEFGMPKEVLLDIIEPLYEQYNLTEDMKETMKGVFETKFQQK